MLLTLAMLLGWPNLRDARQRRAIADTPFVTVHEIPWVAALAFAQLNRHDVQRMVSSVYRESPCSAVGAAAGSHRTSPEDFGVVVEAPNSAHLVDAHTLHAPHSQSQSPRLQRYCTSRSYTLHTRTRHDARLLQPPLLPLCCPCQLNHPGPQDSACARRAPRHEGRPRGQRGA